MIKCNDPETTGGKGLTSSSNSQDTLHHWGTQDRNFETGTGAEANIEEHYLLAPHRVLSLPFSYSLGPVTQDEHCPQWTGPSHFNHQSRKYFVCLPTEQNWWDFLRWGSFFVNDFSQRTISDILCSSAHPIFLISYQDFSTDPSYYCC